MSNRVIYGLEFACNVCKFYGQRNDVFALEEHLKQPHVTFGGKGN